MGINNLKFYITEHIAHKKEKGFIDIKKADETFLLKSDKTDAIKRFDEDIDILKEILNDNNNNNNNNNNNSHKGKNLKEKISDFISNNVLLETFTKDYKRDCEYREFMKKHKQDFALKADVFDVEECVKILKMHNFENNFQMDIKK